MKKIKMLKAPVEVSARHIHLTKKHLEKLFGKNFELEPVKQLSQPGEFASKQTLIIQTKQHTINDVRILGPLRSYSQVEISKTDAYFLGLTPVIRESGKLDGTPGIVLIGPKGKVKLNQGVILATRHLHVSTTQAKVLNLKHGQFIKAAINGPRALIFEHVMIKVADNYDWHLHLDTDEGNAAGIDKTNNTGILFI